MQRITFEWVGGKRSSFGNGTLEPPENYLAFLVQPEKAANSQAIFNHAQPHGALS
jgi:hypothetical protein